MKNHLGGECDVLGDPSPVETMPPLSFLALLMLFATIVQDVPQTK